MSYMLHTTCSTMHVENNVLITYAELLLEVYQDDQRSKECI